MKEKYVILSFLVVIVLTVLFGLANYHVNFLNNVALNNRLFTASLPWVDEPKGSGCPPTTCDEHGGRWVETQPDGDFDRSWITTASSADGTKLIAANQLNMLGRGRLYLSSDSGTTWTETQPIGDYDVNWQSVSSSSDGSKIIAGGWRYNGGIPGGGRDGRLYISSDSGTTWTSIQPAGNINESWNLTSSSFDGSHLVIAGGKDIYISSDSGTTWTKALSVGAQDTIWYTLASSSDGSHILAGELGGRLYLSKDFGTTWQETRPDGNDVDRLWSTTSLNSNGTQLTAGSYGSKGRLYVSSNSGATWTLVVGDVSRNWHSSSISADGTKLIAGNVGRLYVSYNSGTTWTETQPAGDEDRHWKTVSFNEDGTRIIAGALDGRLYVYGPCNTP